MKSELTYEKFLDQLKSEDKQLKEFLTVSESVANIISNLTKERIANNLTQRDLAEISGIKQPAIARMESLKAVPRLDTVVKIAYHLNLNLDFISKQKKEYIIIPSSTYFEQTSKSIQNLEDACTTTQITSTYNTQRIAYSH